MNSRIYTHTQRKSFELVEWQTYKINNADNGEIMRYFEGTSRVLKIIEKLTATFFGINLRSFQ